jgi:hypothetical protein
MASQLGRITSGRSAAFGWAVHTASTHNLTFCDRGIIAHPSGDQCIILDRGVVELAAADAPTTGDHTVAEIATTHGTFVQYISTSNATTTNTATAQDC